MLIITPEAVTQLQAMMSESDASALKFDAIMGEDGGYDCSVSLVADVDPDATVHELEGVKMAFHGIAESIFVGAVIGLNREGELIIEMAGEGCGEGGCSCGEGGCGDGHCH
jgi:Fe-S cluster assembly iron-binding protein IscA